ncbi:MAG: hypothetical protein ACE5EX_09360 [Phycisphaerae bacterium]
MTIVGIFALCVQMLPFDNGSILGFSRVPMTDFDKLNATPDAKQSTEERNLFLNPDRFVVGLAAVLSSGTFSTSHGFYEQNPDLVQTIGWVGAAPSVVSRFAPPGSIAVERTAPVGYVYAMTRGDEHKETPPVYDPQPPAGNREFQMVRVHLKSEARDEKKTHAFTLRQFRLVGRRGIHQPVEQYHAIAIQQEDASDPTNRHIRTIKQGRLEWPVTDLAYVPREGGSTVEVVFDLPAGFQPSFLEYKRAARATLSFEGGAPPAGAEAGARPTGADRGSGRASGRARRGRRSRSGRRASRSGAPNPPPSRRGGTVRGVTAKPGQSHFGDALPVTLYTYQRIQNVDVSRGAIAGGHIMAFLDEQQEAGDQPLNKFVVPAAKRLLHLSSVRLKARSGLGRALSFATTTLQNYFVQDARGRQYKLVGKYALANVGGRKLFELQYFSEPVGSLGGVGKFRRIDEETLTPQDTFVMLFLVDPGARITAFSTGGSATRRDDLTAENLIAPK